MCLGLYDNVPNFVVHRAPLLLLILAELIGYKSCIILLTLQSGKSEEYRQMITHVVTNSWYWHLCSTSLLALLNCFPVPISWKTILHKCCCSVSTLLFMVKLEYNWVVHYSVAHAGLSRRVQHEREKLSAGSTVRRLQSFSNSSTILSLMKTCFSSKLEIA